MSSTMTGSGSGRWTPPTVEELQQLLPQYEIESMLGHGGMGAVYKGKQAALQRPVAIKVLPETLIEGDDDHQYVERFKLEARSMASLDHPAIISVHDFGQTDIGHLYFVMEFIDGMDIEQYIAASGGKVDPDHAVAIVSHVLDALEYAHSKGIIHRDIKPANVLINREGRVKIADFGLAKQFGGDDADVTGLTMTNMAMGTPDYIAPEAMELDSNPDQRADLYAVGVMLFRMLTGKLPRGMFKLPSEQIKGLDNRFDDIIALAMESDPEGRFQNASQFRQKLDDLQSAPVTRVLAQQDTGAVSPAVSGRVVRQSGGNPAAPVAPEPDSPEVRKGRNKLTIALAAVAGIACLIAGFVATRKEPETAKTEPAVVSKKPSTPGEAHDQQPAIAKPAETPSASKKSSPLPANSARLIASKAKDPEPTEKPETKPAVIAPTVQKLKPEPAKPVVIPIPEIADLKSRLKTYRDYRKRATGALIVGLQKQLNEAKEKTIQAGDLSGVDQADEALSAISDFALALGNQFNENHISAIPSFAFNAGTNSEITSLLNSFRSDLRASEIDLTGKLNQSLDICIKSITRKDEIEKARAVRDFQSAIIASLSTTDKTLLANLENGALGTWIDIIPIIDPIENRHIGGTASSSPSHWAKKNGELVFVGENEKDEIFFPATADSPDFDIILSFTRETGVNGFDIKIPVEGGATPIGVGLRRSSAERGALSLKGKIQGERIADIPFFLESAKRKTIKISGRMSGPRKGITIYDGNDEYLHWAGDYRKGLGTISEYQTGQFGIRIYPTSKIAANVTTVFRFHEIRFRSVPADTPPSQIVRDSEPNPEWIELFDGSTLSGWNLEGGDANFTVEDGAIVGIILPNQPSAFLCTEKTFRNFELRFEAKIDGPTNSGVQIRSTTAMNASQSSGGKVNGPQVEITNNPGTSGFIFGESTGLGWLSHNPTSHSHFKNDQFNQFRVLAEGPRIRVWLNEVQIEDLAREDTFKNYANGFIGLQLHSVKKRVAQTKVRWKNIRLLELANTEIDEEEGWLKLIEDNSFSGWSTLRPEVWRIENGEIWKVQGAADSIKKTIPFKTLELKGEFLTTPTGNGGVIVEPVGELALTGTKDKKHGGIWSGGIFGFGANVNTNATPPTNEIQDNTWTPFRLQVSADTMTTWLNGKRGSSIPVTTHSRAPHKVSLQGKPLCEVAYRNLMIREFKP